ncbi:hypothetical protein A2U01_0105618, partial [Trifolium medium]|nr:hypothetical protein [Trifolium medium]
MVGDKEETLGDEGERVKRRFAKISA